MSADPKFKKVEESEVFFSELMLPSKANFNGKIHGGYILSLLDQIAFACASKHSGHYCVTASVDTVDFLMPIEVGELVTLKASVNYVGSSSMVIGIRVDAENIQTGVKKHCNSSYFTMVAMAKDNKSPVVPGLILTHSVQIRRFVRAMSRRELNKRYRAELKSIDFSSEEIIEALKDYRVKVEIKP